MKILSQSIQDTLYFAAKHHKNQVRKKTDKPYIGHLVSTGWLIFETGLKLGVEIDDSVIQGAFLHDILEDTSVSAQEIKEQFGEPVLNYVLAASEEDRTQSWEERKKKTIEKYKCLELEYLLIPIADKIHNLYEMKKEIMTLGEEKCFSKFNAKKERQKWYYLSIYEVLEARLANEILQTDSVKILQAFKENFYVLYQWIFEGVGL